MRKAVGMKAIVWPRVVTWYGRGVSGPGWSCCVGALGHGLRRALTVAKVAVLAGLLRVPLQFLARGPRVRQWGTHWPGSDARRKGKLGRGGGSTPFRR